MKNMADITIVLDRSGSMESVREDTRGGVNRFIADQKAQPGEAVFTLVQFNHEFSVVRDVVPMKDVPTLEFNDYVPRGYTALLDAIGRTVTSIGSRLGALPEDQRPDKVILVIVTDGHENASEEFTVERVREMLKTQQETYKWHVVFLGADIDAVSVASQVGIARAFAANISKDRTSQTYVNLSDKTRSLRANLTKTMAYSNEDRSEIDSQWKGGDTK